MKFVLITTCLIFAVLLIPLYIGAMAETDERES